MTISRSIAIATSTLLITTAVNAACKNTQDAAWIACLQKECAAGIEPQIGMTPEEAAKSKWCFPSRRYTTTTASGTSEQWAYERIFDGRKSTGVNGYLFFDNGKLIAIQRTR